MEHLATSTPFSPRPHPAVSEHGYVAPNYLTTTAELAEHCKQRSYELMHLQSGQRVLDVGCGIGIDVIELAARVATSGAVVGLDADSDMVQQAAQQLALAGIQNAIVATASAHALPFVTGHFDAVRSERMLQHLDDPRSALEEMVRVTRVGGRVVLLDTDWGSLSMHMPDTDLERRLVAFKAGHALRNGYSGRRLFQLMKAAQLHTLSLEVLPIHTTDSATARHACALDDLCAHALRAGAATAREIEAFHSAMRDMDAAGGFFASVNMVLVAGTRGSDGH
jgi:SAM-dependent methyltransferase